MLALNPYLNFGGNCLTAFEFYKSVFGGEFAMVMRFDEMPPDQPSMGDEGNLIMHISFPIGKSILMGSDTPSAYGPLVGGNNFSISIDADSMEEADRLFAGLSAGGNATMPMNKTFWGSYFGMLTDQFGVSWMISFDGPQS